jgi:hypothetical protein
MPAQLILWVMLRIKIIRFGLAEEIQHFFIENRGLTYQVNDGVVILTSKRFEFSIKQHNFR